MSSGGLEGRRSFFQRQRLIDFETVGAETCILYVLNRLKKVDLAKKPGDFLPQLHDEQAIDRLRIDGKSLDQSKVPHARCGAMARPGVVCRSAGCGFPARAWTVRSH